MEKNQAARTNMFPEVTIITPTYQKPDLLKNRAVPSVLAQTYKNFEYIIVDDGSRDCTPHVMKEIQKLDHRIRTFFFETNQGAVFVSNYAIRQARGKYIIFLDHDNELLPTFLFETVKKIEELPLAYGAVCAGAFILYPNNRKITVIPNCDSEFYVAISDGWLIRKEVFFEGNLFYDEEITHDADSDFGIRFFEKYKAAVIKKPLSIRYIRKDIFDPSGASSITPRRIAGLRMFLKKNLKIIEARGTRRERAFLYRRIGKDFIFSNYRREAVTFFLKALAVQQSLRNCTHVIVCICGRFFYKKFYFFERNCYPFVFRLHNRLALIFRKKI